MTAVDEHTPTAADRELVDVANYVCDYRIDDAQAMASAYRCLIDTLAGAFDAVHHPACSKLLGPIVPGATMADGVRVPGTSYELDPASATFNIGCLIRWHDLNDTFTGAAASHPSDNLAGILAVADYLGRRQPAVKLNMKDVLQSLIKAYEIQGLIGMTNKCFGNAGVLDHVQLTKVATTAVVTRMLGGNHDAVLNAVSNAWLEPVLRLYRHAPGAGTRKGWAAADASAQAVRLAFMAVKGEMGYPMALSVKKRGFYDAFQNGEPFSLQRPYGSYVVQNTMLKLVPSAMYGQSAAECAFRVHALIRDRLDQIAQVQLFTHGALLHIMDKTGPLHNAADRDHCVQYIVAIGLLFGRLLISDFEDDFAADPCIDALRDKIILTEDPRFTEGFFDPKRRSSATGLEVRFRDGSTTARIDVEYPSGHPSRRDESATLFEQKFTSAVERFFPAAQAGKIISMCADQARLEATSVDAFMQAFVVR